MTSLTSGLPKPLAITKTNETNFYFSLLTCDGQAREEMTLSADST